MIVSSQLLPQRALACGPIDDSYHFFNLFVPEWIFDKEYSPVLYTTDDYYHIWGEPDYSNDNLDSWMAFFEGQADREALEVILKDTYAEKYSGATREALVNSVLFEGSKLPTARIRAAQDYLLLALELETLANRNKQSWAYEPDTLSGEEANALVSRVETAIQQEKFDYLKERYAYQLMKSYRYTDQIDQAIAVYHNHFTEEGPRSLIHYWALDHLAGLQLQKGEEAKGYYHFLQVFKACRSRRHSAYYSFHIQSEEIWKATYALCESPEDKALMHFLRGSKEGTLGLQDAKEIFSLLGDHEWLRLLVAREVNKLESLNLTHYNEQPVKGLLAELQQNGRLLKNREQEDYAGQLLKFASTVYFNNPDSPFWAVAKGYLEFLLGKFDAARSTLKENEGLEGSFEKIAREIKLAMFIIGQEAADAEEEAFIAREIVEIFDDREARFYTENNNEEFILDLLAHKAEAQGEAIKADFFRRALLSDFKVDPAPGRVDSLLEFVRREEHTPLELLALKHYMGNNMLWDAFLAAADRQLEEFEFQLLDIRGTLLMRNPNQLEEALALFSSLPDHYDFPLKHNPFNMSIADCVWDCPPRTGTSYTRNSFVAKLIEIRDIAGKTNSATDYYLLGNAYYNMSYFGPAYYLMNYFRSAGYYTGYYDCSEALAFYEKAIEYAPGKEFAARACFMAAKAEQNLFFVEKTKEGPGEEEYWWGKYVINDWGYGRGSYEQFQQEIKEDGYRKYFEKLRSEYNDTEYFSRAIRECKYLEYYTRRF